MIDKASVKIKTFTPIGEDERGFTSEFVLPRKQQEFIYLFRKEGTLSGNTYHEGKDSATNPKTFILLSGRINFSYRRVGAAEKYSEVVTAPAIIEVAPFVVHNIITLSDCTFLEANSIKDIQGDRVREEV